MAILKNKTKQINARITPELKKRIDRVLLDHHETNSVWLVNLIEGDVRKRELALGIPRPKKRRSIPERIISEPKKYEWD